MATQLIPVQGARTVRVASDSGRVDVIAEDRTDIDTSPNAQIRRDEQVLTVSGGSDAITVRIPRGMDVVVGTEDSRVSVVGEAGTVAVATASGRVSVASAASADVRTVSGRVEIGTVDGSCRVRTDSGAVKIGTCGAVDATTDSGRVRLGRVLGPVNAHCTSGRIDIEMGAAHQVIAETVSGRITVRLPDGVDPAMVQARSVSGRVQVEPA